MKKPSRSPKNELRAARAELHAAAEKIASAGLAVHLAYKLGDSEAWAAERLSCYYEAFQKARARYELLAAARTPPNREHVRVRGK